MLFKDFHAREQLYLQPLQDHLREQHRAEPEEKVHHFHRLRDEHSGSITICGPSSAKWCPSLLGSINQYLTKLELHTPLFNFLFIGRNYSKRWVRDRGQVLWPRKKQDPDEELAAFVRSHDLSHTQNSRACVKALSNSLSTHDLCGTILIQAADRLLAIRFGRINLNATLLLTTVTSIFIRPKTKV